MKMMIELICFKKSRTKNGYAGKQIKFTKKNNLGHLEILLISVQSG